MHCTDQANNSHFLPNIPPKFPLNFPLKVSLRASDFGHLISYCQLYGVRLSCIYPLSPGHQRAIKDTQDRIVPTPRQKSEKMPSGRQAKFVQK